MRKLLSVLLAVAMICALAITANADTLDATTTTASKDVNATYVEGAKAGTVYSVDVAWGDMQFTYTDRSEGVWNPATHTYDNKTEAAWAPAAADSGNITVTNHSNAAVGVAFAYTPAEGSTVTAAFDNATATLAAAVENDVENAPKATVNLSITGGTISATGKIGTVTVTLDATEETTTKTVTFTDNSEMSLANESGEVYLYAWNGADISINTTWPGQKMTKGEGNVYTFELDVNTYDHIIIGNGLDSTAGGKQTVDIDLTTLGETYNLSVSGFDSDAGKYTVSNS